MVFVNGTPLTQVMAYADLKPGTFFFSDAYQMLHITPPKGTNMDALTRRVDAQWYAEHGSPEQEPGGSPTGGSTPHGG